MSRIAYALTIALACWSASARAQSATPTGSVEEVVLNLGTQSFDRDLPFDIPFLVRGEVDKGAASVKLRFREWCKRSRWRLGNCRALTPQSASWTDAGRPWKPFAATGGTKDTFRILVQPLQANRYYEFHIEVVRPVDATSLRTIRQATTASLSATFYKVDADEITEAEAGDIRNALIADVSRALRGDTVVAPGTLFDPGVPYRPRESELNDYWDPVLVAQEDVEADLESYAASTAAIERHLRSFRDDPVTLKVMTPLRAVAETDAALASILAPIDRFLLMRDTALLRTVRGLPPGAQKELGRESTEAEADAIAARHRGTAVTADDVRERLGRIAQRQDAKNIVDSLIAAAAFTEADLQAFGLLADGPPLRQISAHARNAATIADDLTEAQGRRAAAIETLTEQLQAQIVTAGIAHANTVGVYDTFRSRYVSVEPGVMYAPALPQTVTYTGINLYFRPINKDAPLAVRDGFFYRFAPTVGFTLRSIDNDAKGRSDLIGSVSALVGAGMRISQSIRVGGGFLFFMRDEENPFKTGSIVTRAPYVSLAIDIDAKNFPTTIQDWLTGK